MSASKAIIISYFFPPCSLTASQRTHSWLQYFHQEQIYPIVITRNWDRPIKEEKDVLYSSGTHEVHEKNNTGEIYFLPYKNSLRDRIFIKNKSGITRLFSKLLTFKELVFQNFFLSEIVYCNLYQKARSLLKSDPDIKTVIVSGGPFIQFRFGNLLKKEFPHINWIADYRDDWTTSEINSSPTLLHRVVKKLDKRSEKKWLSNASFITSVSPWYTHKISSFVEKKGYTIYNGYYEDRIPQKDNLVDQNQFTILYNGTLYPTQPIEDVLDVFKIIVAEFPAIRFKFQFPGLAFDRSQVTRIQSVTNDIDADIEILPRIDRKEVLQMQQNADVLLMLTHTGKKGVTSSKIFEYMLMNKPILVYPSDKDVLEKLISETETGRVCDTKKSLHELLSEWISNKQSGNRINIQPNWENIKKYSRENQAVEFARLIREQYK